MSDLTLSEAIWRLGSSFAVLSAASGKLGEALSAAFKGADVAQATAQAEQRLEVHQAAPATSFATTVTCGSAVNYKWTDDYDWTEVSEDPFEEPADGGVVSSLTPRRAMRLDGKLPGT